MFVPTHTATIYRSTKFLIDDAAYSATPTVARQPLRAVACQVQVTGTPAGTVTVNGTVNGVSDSEVLTWTGSAAYKTTMKKFTAISSVTASLSGASRINMTGLGDGGDAQLVEYALKTGIPIGLDRTKISTRPTWENPHQGSAEESEGMMRLFFEDTWRPRSGDHAVISTGERFLIVAVREGSALGGAMSAEWLCTVTREEL